MESLQRLHHTAAVGGLLPSEALEFGLEHIGDLHDSAVHSAVLKLHHQQEQVWYACTYLYTYAKVLLNMRWCS